MTEVQKVFLRMVRYLRSPAEATEPTTSTLLTTQITH